VKEDDDDEEKKYVLVACNDGADHCAGVAVARAVAADLFLNKKEDECGETRTEPAPLVTKDCVRRRLAAVSARHPEASPTRGTLKQVFNYLLDASKGRRADGG
jgi:tRNA A64-2'-O-ribosylphosphate transferase